MDSHLPGPVQPLWNQPSILEIGGRTVATKTCNICDHTYGLLVRDCNCRVPPTKRGGQQPPIFFNEGCGPYLCYDRWTAEVDQAFKLNDPFSGNRPPPILAGAMGSSYNNVIGWVTNDAGTPRWTTQQ